MQVQQSPNNCTKSTYPFLWRGESGAIWLAIDPRHSVCLVQGSTWYPGTVVYSKESGSPWNYTREHATDSRLPPGHTLTISND